MRKAISPRLAINTFSIIKGNQLFNCGMEGFKQW
jgi:hypothetical protein